MFEFFKQEYFKLSLNSTMVRLKQKHFLKFNRANRWSQFHYGSIKTIKNGIETFKPIKSQFHYGSIKTFQ